MSLKTLIVNNKYLYNILNEISENINLKIVNGSDKNVDPNNFDDYIFLSTKKESNQYKELIVTEFPIRIKKLIEVININFLKKSYNLQSNIKVGEYELDLNSRTLKANDTTLDLTEMEANVILFLKNSSKPITIKDLQKNVWHQAANLETHTVETHIYRLRRKIKEKFQDDNFIKSTKNGYAIK
jgi:DNA-binding response OmpR family regulator|tara:strand:+ start:73 stop:624 length:552 start_codon:yes stop_codon:yes gene_type:complete